MLLQASKTSDMPLYVQIMNQLKDMILREELPKGIKMPSERTMAQLLHVHRNTVKRVYQELKAEGYLESFERKGFFVCEKQGSGAEKNRIYGLRWGDIVRDKYINRRIEERFSRWLSRDAAYSFSGDEVQSEEVGREDISNILMDIANSPEENLYAITHKQGSVELRKQIATFLKTKGIQARISEIQVLSESFQAIEYVSNMIVAEGETIIMPETVCPEVIRVFVSLGAKIVTAEMDEEGMICEQLERLIPQHNPKLIYVEPDFANPTGTVMSLSRRKQLLELSYQYNIPIIEEDSSSDLRYEGRAIPSLKALDQHESVIFIYSFYCKLPSGIRIAFMVGNKRVISDISTVIQSRVLCEDVISQRILKEYFARGLFEKNLRKINENHCRKKTLMYSLLQEAGHPGLEMNNPEGGVFLWCKLPDHIDENKLRSVAIDKGIAYMPGNSFFAGGEKGANYIRLNYAFCSEQNIIQGIEQFNLALKESGI